MIDCLKAAGVAAGEHLWIEHFSFYMGSDLDYLEGSALDMAWTMHRYMAQQELSSLIIHTDNLDIFTDVMACHDIMQYLQAGIEVSHIGLPRVLRRVETTLDTSNATTTIPGLTEEMRRRVADGMGFGELDRRLREGVREALRQSEDKVNNY